MGMSGGGRVYTSEKANGRVCGSDVIVVGVVVAAWKQRLFLKQTNITISVQNMNGFSMQSPHHHSFCQPTAPIAITTSPSSSSTSPIAVETSGGAQRAEDDAFPVNSGVSSTATTATITSTPFTTTPPVTPVVLFTRPPPPYQIGNVVRVVGSVMKHGGKLCEIQDVIFNRRLGERTYLLRKFIEAPGENSHRALPIIVRRTEIADVERFEAVDCGRHKLYMSDFKTLTHDRKLNEGMMDYLLRTRPWPLGVEILTTHLATKIMQNRPGARNPPAIFRNPQTVRFVLVPIHAYDHWSSLVIDVERRIVHHFDSRAKLHDKTFLSQIFLALANEWFEGEASESSSSSKRFTFRTIQWGKQLHAHTSAIWVLHFFDRFVQFNTRTPFTYANQIKSQKEVKMERVDESEVVALRTLLINRYLC